MKKLVPILVTVMIVVVIALIVINRAKQQGNITVHLGNHDRLPVEIILGRHQGAQCGMNIQQLQDSAQAVAPDGKTWFFDDVGCLAQWLGDNQKPDEMVLWVYTRDTKEWFDGRMAWYSRTDGTNMGYGFAAYKSLRGGLIPFEEMVSLMQDGQNLSNPQTREELLGNN